MVRRFLKKVLVPVWLVFVVGLMVMSPMAMASGILNEMQINLYSQNSIFFYLPKTKDCSNAPFDSDWDGSCSAMTAERIQWVQKYLSVMQTVASKNGIPWELIPAQTFQESSGGKSEACDYNPLGLKAATGHDACSNGFAKFNSYEDAFDYYINVPTPISELKGRYPNDPYSAVAFIQYGASKAYASCDSDSESYPQCVGHMGEPTPGYVNSVSSLICGIQKWAKSEGIAISSVTWENYSPSSGGGGSSSGGDTCDVPESGNLADYVKKWAWPNYEKGKKKQMPAYEDHMKNVATYKGDCDGNDCGAFVANIIKYSGWDPSYPQCNTSCQLNWLNNNWKKVSASSLRLGDVGYKPGHIILYVGSIPGFNSNTASASQCDRAPMAGADKDLTKYTWYRKK